MIPSSLLLSSLYLASIPTTTAWVFSWTQPNGDLLTNHGSQAQSCQTIDNPKGNIFDWQANGDNVCIYLYSNTECANPSAGYTCEPWPWDNHPAGSDIFSYEVVNNGTTSSNVASTTPPATTATTSSTTTSTTATATSSSATSSSTPGNTSSGSSLSGGAIAGIVVGVLAAAAIAGVLFFFLGWRRRRPSNSASAPEQSETAMSELQAADDKPYQDPPPSSSQSLYQQQRLRELPGSQIASEMGPGVERAELDGSPIYGKF